MGHNNVIIMWHLFLLNKDFLSHETRNNYFKLSICCCLCFHSLFLGLERHFVLNYPAVFSLATELQDKGNI